MKPKILSEFKKEKEAMQQLSPANINHHSVYAVVADARSATFLVKRGMHFHPLHQIRAVDLTGLDNETIGRNGGYGMGRHSYEPTLEESRQSEIGLSKSIAAWLKSESIRKSFDQLVIVASPTMLGEIRKKLDSSLLDKIIATSNKEFANHARRDLETELVKIIRPDK